MYSSATSRKSLFRWANVDRVKGLIQSESGKVMTYFLDGVLVNLDCFAATNLGEHMAKRNAHERPSIID